MVSDTEKSTPRLLEKLTQEENRRLLPGNFHCVSEELGIYRSSQPSKEEFAELEKQGFAAVLNVRMKHSDESALSGFRLKCDWVPMHILTAADMVKALRIIRDAGRPLLIHGKNGTDRTGAVVAGCRIVFENWQEERAFQEFEDRKFGAHRLIYCNLRMILRAFDWSEIRRQVLSAPSAPQTAADNAQA